MTRLRNVVMRTQPEARGHCAIPVALPGQGDDNVSATLTDQSGAVVAAVDAAAGRPMVVGHSAACSLAWLAADARPTKISQVTLIGGFPVLDGQTYFDVSPTQDGTMPFPGHWPMISAPTELARLLAQAAEQS